MYGEAAGYEKDEIEATYDFDCFIQEKGITFERYVYEELDVRPLISRAITVQRAKQQSQRTRELLEQRVPVLAQAVLMDFNTKRWGIADLLVSTDWFREAFPEYAREHLQEDLDGYIVGEIKFQSESASSSHLQKVRIAQLNVYIESLARFAPTPSWGFFILRSPSAFPLGSGEISVARISSEIRELTINATNWIRFVRKKGNELVPGTHPELFPNMKNKHDSPWRGAKKQIAQELDELTRLYYVSVQKRSILHSKGVYTCSELGEQFQSDPSVLDVVFKPGGKARKELEAILEANYGEQPVVFFENPNVASLWKECAKAEFFVDFETFNSLNVDFDLFPELEGTPMIFMIGCGDYLEGEWKFKCFVAEHESHQAEHDMIEAFLSYVDSRLSQYNATLEETRFYHWYAHEPREMRSAAERHREPSWVQLPWVDLMVCMQNQPIAIKGSFDFSLKSVAPALQRLGHIQTSWPRGTLADGLAAMVGAWKAYAIAEKKEVPVQEVGIMRKIIDYNEIDCKVMGEILEWMRSYRTRTNAVRPR